MNQRELDHELLRLTLLWQQHAADDEDLARLERLLLDQPEARQLYLRVVDDTITLSEVADQADEAVAVHAGERGASIRRPLAWLQDSSTTWAWLAVALSLAGVLLWGIPKAMIALQPVKVAERPIGRVVNVGNVRWSDAATPYQAWSPLVPGDQLQFDQGKIELSMESGVQIIIEGPADFELLSAQAAIARGGKLVARVSPGAIGFQVRTPHARVIDLGTAFGIAVTPGVRTDVVVYEGAIDLEVPSPDGHENERRLVSGEALSVGPRGSLARIVNVEDDSFLPPPQLANNVNPLTNVIRSVTDSISSSDTAKYYRIQRGGIEDDCPAFVDRLHQWNGLDDRGITAELRDAEYVMTFNDTKIRADLQVSIHLGVPARLYVLFDDRVPAPDWLVDAFVDTGQDIGLDEGYNKEGSSGPRTGTGAGNSIDRVFSIWRRDVLEAGSVTLGPVTATPREDHPRYVSWCMYGIAAKPLDVQEEGSRAIQIKEL